MRVVLFIAFTAILLSLASASKKYNLKQNAKDLFDEYLEDNGLYYSGYEYASRFVVFKANLKEVERQQKDPSNAGVRIDLAGSAHLSDDEWKTQRLGSLPPSQSAKRDATATEELFSKRDVLTRPTSINWKSKGKVTSVKNQGSCGDCWAFAAAAVIESAHAIAGHALTSGSAQHLLDCTPVSHGCNGGWQGEAYNYAQKNHGIKKWADYPYRRVKGSCKNPAGTKIGVITNHGVLGQRDYTAIMNYVGLKGPVGVLIDATYWRYYSGGVITKGSKDPMKANHSVVVVGYGKTTSGVPVWIIKNSWGTGWGQNGYAYVKRSSSASYNYCGVTNWAHYATAT
jgi:cathepsin L